jgi:hypothetical protein
MEAEQLVVCPSCTKPVVQIRSAGETAETSQICRRGLRLVAADVKW